VHQNKELLRQIETPFMKVIPQASNHIIIVTRDNNAIDVSADPSPDNKFFIITKSGQRVVIDSDGSPAIQCGR
jgi:hypothetical protein